MEIDIFLIVSAFVNEIDYSKVNEYKERLIAEDIFNEVPPILGFPGEITEDHVGTYFMSGSEITLEDVGKSVWFVSDGHHRTLAFLDAYEETRLLVFKAISVKLDRACIVSEKDLIDYNNQQNL